MKHILALTDFSEVAENAVAAAFNFAKQHQAFLTIYHLLEDQELVNYQFESQTFEQVDMDNPLFSLPFTKWSQLAKEKDVKFKYMIGAGNLSKNISSLHKSLDIDLIIMGSQGANKKEGDEWGSNTEKLVKKVDCPVLVIKSRMKDYVMDNIVFASSFDLEEREILQFALKLLAPPSFATIHLLSVNTASFFTQPSVLMREVMKDFEVMVHPRKVKSHFYPDLSVDAGIRHFLNDVKPDVLIMNNRDHKPIKRFFTGDHTLSAVNNIQYPVLCIDYKKVEKPENSLQNIS